MDNQPAPKSRKIWWVFGSIAFVALLAIGASGNSNTQAPAPNVQTATVAQQVAQPQVQPQQNTLSNDNYYTNSDGNAVHSPAYSDTVPAGATAQCRDGTYSFSQHRSGTCSHHGGVMRWL